MMNPTHFRRIVPLAAAVLMASGCAVTEDSLRASSETLQNTSEATSDFTSSTSHEGDKEPSRKARDFAARNMDQLRRDMAVGGGAYLNSLAELLDVPEAERARFGDQAKGNFALLFDGDNVSADTLLLRMNDYVRPLSPESTM